MKYKKECYYGTDDAECMRGLWHCQQCGHTYGKIENAEQMPVTCPSCKATVQFAEDPLKHKW